MAKAISSAGSDLDLDIGTLDSDEWFVPNNDAIRNVVPGSVEDDEGTGKGRSRLREGRQAMLDREPSKGIPTLDEWMDFASRVLIKTATEYYIDYAFRGIDENLLTDRDVERIKLVDKERNRIARPFAELAYKSKWARKHGRSIIAAGDSVDAVVQLGMWYSRVNRIARRYHALMNGQVPPPMPQPQRPPPRHAQAEAPASQMRGGDDERTGQGSQANGHDRNWRPPVNGTVLRNFDG